MNPNIDIYLRSAFKELDAFAIPRIGTFRKVHRAAQVAKEYGELRPPVLEIEFESEVKDSLLLTSYLTNNIHMGKGEAEQIVSDISQTISHALRSRKRFEIAEIGSLRRSAEGKVSFNTIHNNRSIFADDYFGLKPIQYKSPVKAMEFEMPSDLIDAQEEPQVHEVVVSPSKGAMRIVAMLGLILMFGITLIYTVRTERASIASGLKAPQELDGPAILPSNDKAPLPNDLVAESSTESTQEDTRGDNSEESQDAKEEIETTDPINIGDAKDLFASILESEPPVVSDPSDFQTTRDGSRLAENSPVDVRSVPEQQGSFDALQKDKQEIPTIKYQGAGVDPHSYLIIGSYTNQQKALDFAKLLKSQVKEGTQHSLLVLAPMINSKDPYRVSLYHSTDRAQVNRVKKDLERLNSKEIDSPWIFPLQRR